MRTQSEHFADYNSVIEALRARGLAYRCFRTRNELKELAGSNGIFTGDALSEEEEAKRLEMSQRFAWRLSLAAAKAELGAIYDELSYSVRTQTGLETCHARPSLHGDIVIARKDSPSAYHIAATHDDALQGITHVIRGEDLIDAPHIHTLLQVLMGWSQPIYQHHPLILGTDGKKLSKRHASVSLAALRAEGMTAEQIRARLGF